MRRAIISTVRYSALTFLLMLPSILHAQTSWTRLQQPYGGTVFIFVETAQGIVVGTESNGMHISSDDGLTWQPYGIGTDGLIPVGATASGNLIAVTDDEGGLYRTTDNGLTWERRASGIEGDMRYATVAPSDDLFAMTDDAVWRSTDEGGSWANVLTSDSLHISWLTIAPDGTLFVTEESSSLPVRRSTDNGATWKIISEDTIFTAFAFGEAGEVFVATANGILRSTDNGDSFAPFALEGYAARSPLAFTRDADGALWLFTENDGLFRVSSDGLQIQTFSAVTGECYNVSAMNSGTILLGYRGLGVGRSSDDGESWAQTGLPGAAPIGQLVEEGTGTLLAGIFFGGLTRSTDGGETWAPLSVPLDVVNVLLANSTGTILAATTNSMLYRTTDGGTSWEGGSSNYFLDGHIASNGTILMASYAGIYRSTDDGQTLEQVMGNDGVLDLGFSPNGDAWGSTGGSLFRSTDDGVTWAEVGYGNNSPDRSDLEVTGNGTLIAAAIDGSDGSILRSTDKGATWEKGEFPCANGPEGHMWIGYDGVPYIVTNCGLFRSTDEGVSWDLYADLPDGWWINGLVFTSSGTIYAGTEHGVFTAQGSLSAPQNDESEDSGNGMLTIAPNPVRSSFTATLHLEHSTQARLILYDVKGKEIGKMERRYYSAGEHQVEWNVGSDLAPGIYVLQLMTDTGTTSQKVEIVR